MNDNKQLQECSELDYDSIDFDDLENKLESELQGQMLDLEILKEDSDKIGNPESLGEAVMRVVWDQFINQVGVVAGEDFIKENRGLKLDLRKSAHTQTTENFKNGKIATHNSYIDYQKRYDDWQANFQHDKDGNVITRYDRIDKEEQPILKKGYREPYDNGRRKGSASVHMDETISVAEQVSDPEANAHLSLEERVEFDQSDINLNPMDSSANESKGRHKATNWLESERDGKKPAERFNIDEEQIRKKDAEARAEYEKRKKEGEKRSIETGKQSRREEAFRIGGKALRSVIMGLLASLIKDIIRELIAWFRTDGRKLATFIAAVKDAIKSFLSNIKKHLLNAGNALLTTISTAILGPVVSTIKKAWIYLKQGYESVKSAIKFLKDPANRNMPFNIKMLQVGKIIIVGFTAGGAILLGETIEKGLMTIPVFAFNIPWFGSLASILGMFFGALVSGIIGAFALNLIDKAIAKETKTINEGQQIEKRNAIIQVQDELIAVTQKQVENKKYEVAVDLAKRHQQAGIVFENIGNKIIENTNQSDKIHRENNDKLDDIFESLNKIGK